MPVFDNNYNHQTLREMYIKGSSWIRDMSAPLKPRKKFNPYGAAGAGPSINYTKTQ